MQKNRRAAKNDAGSAGAKQKRQASPKQGLRESSAAHKQNSQEYDISSKRIFSNPTLCAQFLRDYSGIPQLADVQPEDIEKVNLRYHLFDEAELNADSAVRVYLKDAQAWPFSTDGQPETQKKVPLYVIPLIDHKSKVDYNVTMQLLTYMVCIWYDWKLEWKDKTLNAENKEFVYPFILPIVYYEGTDRWTAAMRFADRIYLGDVLPQYVPDFTYLVVRNHDYTNEQLIEKQDEMSLLMLLNKIQRISDISGLRQVPPDKVNDIIRDSPRSVLDILAGTVRKACRKLNVPEEETAEYIRRIEDRDMGYLFENMEKMDIQEERRKTQEAEKRLAEAENRYAEAAKNHTRELAEKHKESIGNCIHILRVCQKEYEFAKKEIAELFQLTEEEAEEAMQQYWR